jgi:hypothetical protein
MQVLPDFRLARGVLASGGMADAAENLIVVRRGETSLFENLTQELARSPQPVQVIWDRRMRDRRVIIRDDVDADRRTEERRATPSATWTTHGFIVTRAEAVPEPRRVVEREPVESAAVVGSGVCPHLCGRGLRTDDMHLRLYARQLRQGRRHVGDDDPVRLRPVFRQALA